MSSPAVTVLAELDDADRSAVHALAGRVAARTGAPPLNDRSLLAVDGGPAGRHLLVRDGAGGLIAYALVLPDPSGAGSTVELATDPASTAGDALLDALLAHAEQLVDGGGDVSVPVTVWSHGRSSPVGDAAARRGYARTRALWQLRRPLDEAFDTPALPGGVTLRAFRPGTDEDAWLAVNAAAFAEHREQGRLTRAELEELEREPWFDAAGFLLAWDGPQLVGFHWTKIHPAPTGGTGPGEVYVLGVDPSAAGRHLGRPLLAAGLRSLAARGCDTVLLYVDEDNPRAMALYERAGFARHDLDAAYTRSVPTHDDLSRR